jgi:hypothetical protein
MKKRTFTLVVLMAIALVLLFGVGQVNAADKTVVPCYEQFVDTLNPGTWSYPDGNIHIRGMVQLFRETADDPRNIGYNTVVLNANWQSDWTGPMWGTFSFETDEGGLWEGTWAGRMTEEGSVYNASGKGYGIYAGMKMWVDMDYGTCTATFLEK